MTISRVKPAGWALNEKLTSSQQNQVDLNTTYALDKRSGQTDTLASVVSVTGGVSVSSGGLFALSSGSLAGFSGNLEFLSGALTAFKNGSNTVFDNGSNLIFASGSEIDGYTDVSLFLTGQIVSMSTLALYGTFLTANTSIFGIGGTFNCLGSSTINLLTDVNIGAGIKYHGGSRSYTRSFVQSGCDPSFTIDVDLDFTFITIGLDTPGLAWLDLGTAGIPNGAYINEINVYYQPSNSHAGLPAILPRFKVIRRGHGFFSSNTMATVAETAGSLGTYETARTLTKTFSAPGLQLDFDTYSYYIVFEGEDGPTAHEGLRLYPFKIEFTSAGMNDY